MDRGTKEPLADTWGHGPIKERLLAFDVRRRKAGFVLLECIGRLMDWGVRTYGKRSRHAVASARFQFVELLDRYRPSIVIVRPTSGPLSTTRNAVHHIVECLRKEAETRATAIEVIQTKQIEDMFATFQCRNKHEINTLLARWFGELSWKLPPKRKPWKPEPHNQIIFDAAAAAATFLTREPNTQ